jgi:glycosyltransferase involved in cell wall biosynthesis
VLISIFTPTHDVRYVTEAYHSLLEQDDPSWEWVLVPNGEVGSIPELIKADHRVRICPAPEGMSGIGRLKRFACSQCKGEYFLELDHDDQLTNNALKTVREWIEKEDRPGFLFSDFVNFYEDGQCQVFREKFGWKSYPFPYKGRDYTAMRAFEVTPSSLSLIFFAPNHVRIWSRTTYEQAGGHDESMEVGDDHELLCRTYLTGAKMVHIPEVLYLYRLQAEKGNTYLKQNKEIQTIQQQTSNRYVYKLIDEWCHRQGLLKVDLGGRFSCPEGFMSVDLTGADFNCDIRHGLPFEDSSIGCVRAFDFLEHIPHCADSSCRHGADGGPMCVVGLMNEIYRVLVPGGWLLSKTPSSDGRGAFQDPTHCSFWNPNSFWYYTREEQAKYVSGLKCKYQANRVWQTFPTEWHKQNNIPYVFADLVCLKGQDQPGLVEI